MRYILGIDPSRRSGTGLALVDLDGPTIAACCCIKLSERELRDMDHADQEAFIAKTAADWIASQPRIDLVGLEWPPDRERGMAYRRANGTIGVRSLTSNSQWRLIGRLEEVVRDLAPIARVTPQQGKKLLGVSDGRKPVQEIADLTGYPAHLEAKYVAEAVSDAASAALAAAHLWKAFGVTPKRKGTVG